MTGTTTSSERGGSWRRRRARRRCGRRGQALRQYLACRHALVTELGVEPNEETARLQARVLAGEEV